MASISANGGADRYWRHQSTGSRAVLCRNGKVLVNPGGASSWRHTPDLTLETLAERGWQPLDDATSRASVTRTTAAAIVRQRRGAR